MAIQKQSTIVNSSGGSPSVSGNYWVTKGIYLAPDLSSARITMALYGSHGSFVSGVAPVAEKDYILSGPQNPITQHLLAENLEEALIAYSPDFVSGTQV